MVRFWMRHRTKRASQASRPARQSARPRVELLEDRTLLSVALAADVNPVASSSRPSGFVSMNGAAYFFADDGQHGVELWRTDGTAANTRLVKDINPGSGSAGLTFSPSPVVLGNDLYFFADGGANGIQLWKSDGSAGGTAPLTGAAPGTVAYFNQAAADSAQGLVFFVDPSTGQLWKTDGTAGNAAAVKDGSGNPINFAFDPATVGGSVYFAGQQSGSSGSQAGLWVTDGTQGGTSFLKSAGGSISDLTDVNGTAYFVVTTAGANGLKDVALWTSNGTASGTSLVHDFGSVSATGPSSVTDLTAFNGKLYFAADDHGASPDLGTELWVSDGTGTGTHVVRDIKAGAGSGLGAEPDLTAFNNTLYFMADSGPGQALWQTDGTAANTVSVADGHNPSISATAILSAVNGSLYFAGSNASGSGLWKTNGTASGTVFVQSAVIGAAPPGSSATANGMLVFPGSGPTHGTELWASDGTPGGTGLLLDINPGSSSEPAAITDVGGTAFFLADDGNPSDGAVQLWKSNGTSGSLQLVKSFAAGETAGFAAASPSRLLNVNGTVYFFAYDGNPADGAVQLWKSNGTTASTVLVKGFTPRQDGPFGYLDGLPNTLTAVGGKVFFVADDGAHGLELWQTDGTSGGTTLVRDLNPGADGSNPGELTAVGSTLYFTAGDGTNSGLWQTDGSTTTFLQAGASNLANVNGTLYFTAPDSHGVPALWKTTGASPTMVASLGGTSARLPTAVGSTLYFLVDSSGSEALWSSNGTGASTGPLHAFAGAAPLSELTAVGSTLYFVNGGTELWASSGSASGTGKVASVTSASGFFGLTNVGGTLYFAAKDTTHGQEIWTSDGTANGTRFVQAIAPAPPGSFPHDFASVGGQLFLAANDGTHGVELFADNTGTTRFGTSTTLSASATSVNPGQPVTFTATVHAMQGATFDNGGSVTFTDGGVELGTASVGGGGVATLSVVLAPGGHSVTAVYSGDVHFTGSPSQPVGVTVTGSQIKTTTQLTASPSSVQAGQFVTFTATVSPAPDGGAVDFNDGQADLGSVGIGPNGVATLKVALPAGTHNVTAVYSGDPNFGGSTSGASTVTVAPGSLPATQTFLSASAGSVTEGQSIAFTASVTAPKGGFDNGGQVDFWDGQVDLGASGLDPKGTATLNAFLAAGTHNVTAVYSGDGSFSGSMSGAVTVTVTRPSSAMATTTALDVSPSTVTDGSPVSVTATVTPASGTIDGGTVDFVLDDQTDLGSAAVNSQGVATLSPDPVLALGSHHITAVYSGDTNFAGSTSEPVDVTVTPASAVQTDTFLMASATDVSADDPVTFTASVKPQGGGNVDGGQVDFKDGETDLGLVDVNAQGAAQLTTALPVGTHSVTAVYFGHNNFAGSTSSAVPVKVSPGPATTSTFLFASTSGANPGDPVTFTATVSATSGTPRFADGGQVLFLDGGTIFASASVDPHTGAATVTTTFGPGTHRITAAYQGDAGFAGSMSSPVEVTVAEPPPPPPFLGDATAVMLPAIIPAPGHGSGHSGGVSETLILWNYAGVPLQGPIFVVFQGIRHGVRLHGAAGFLKRGKTQFPVMVIIPPAGVVQPLEAVILPLQFTGGKPGAFSVIVSAGLAPV